MKYPTLRFVFDRRNVATTERKASVYLEVAYKRRRRDVPTGIRLFSNEWDNHKRVINKTNALELNEQLDNVQAHVRKVLTAMQNNNEEFTLEKFDVYMKNTDNSGSFIDFMWDRIAKRSIKENTRKQHISAWNLLNEYSKIKTFADLSPAMLKDFDDFLHNGIRSQVTIHGIHKRIKPYIIEAYQKGLIKEKPYDKFKIERGESAEREFLTEKEIKKIMQLKLTDKLAHVRDMFIFCCYTGLAFADMCLFNYKKDTDEVKGIRFIDGERIKTGRKFYTPILPPAQRVLEKYNFELPVISNQKFNDYLHIIEEKAELRKPLTSHIARHTFATIVTLANKVPIEDVRKMLGHKSIRTTELYAKVLKKTIEKESLRLAKLTNI